MANLATGNAVIGQSGGPTAVINQSLAGVVEGLNAGLAASGKVKRIFGTRHGVRGLVKPGSDGLLDLTSIDKAKLEAVARAPSAAPWRRSPARAGEPRCRGRRVSSAASARER